MIELFPAYPHEGRIGVPVHSTSAWAIATGTSKVTHRLFNLGVAAERTKDEQGNYFGRV